MVGWMGLMDRWVGVCMDGWVDDGRWVDRWTDRWMDGQCMNRQIWYEKGRSVKVY